MNNLKGVFPPIITTFKENGSIDLEASKKHIDFLVARGVDGIAFFGTSGEFFSISLEEKKNYIDEVLKYVNGRVKILVGVGGTNKNEVIEFLDYLKEKEIAGVLLINPYFVVYDENEVEDYYNYIAQKTEFNIIIYNFPQLTGFNFNPELVKRLVRKNKNIVGIKDTISDQGHLIDMLEVKEENKDFIVYCAFESQAFGALINGVEGFINATANFVPEFTVGLWKNYQEKNLEQCSEYYQKMCDAMKVYKLSSPLLLACKQAVYDIVLGYEGFERKPALPLSNENKEKLKEILRELLK
ncbi:MAG: dihydrodipicolinate synthase family protein [Fusobacterium sp.]|jgi:dihydrodipicolinate synthase/N-acetylneuraminate lyase|uniref:dihydrodipicolinate synthase family protein n=1 Tax=Fusobacterium sp. TaxID=68766 RepID=UPI002941F9EC|nr:dihydrodipicolinate synthase family protein [Fusobacterium sp.]MDY3060268.1 dihydrodipicolinate synthase family protein [Fusobacterium sp.]